MNNPVALLSYNTALANEPVTITMRQTIAANQAHDRRRPTPSRSCSSSRPRRRTAGSTRPPGCYRRTVMLSRPRGLRGVAREVLGADLHAVAPAFRPLTVIERVPLATSTVRVVTERPRVALTVTLPASDRRKLHAHAARRRARPSRGRHGATRSRTANTESGGMSLANGCSLSGGGGGGGRPAGRRRAPRSCRSSSISWRSQHEQVVADGRRTVCRDGRLRRRSRLPGVRPVRVELDLTSCGERGAGDGPA